MSVITKTRVTALLAALALLSVAGIGGAAAEPIDGYNASSNVQLPPSQDYEDSGFVIVNLEDNATITESNISIVDETGTSYSDVEPDSSMFVANIQQSTIENQSDGELMVDIEIDGSVAQTVTMSVKTSNADVTDSVNASELQDASNVTVTVDKSEISDLDSLTWDRSGGEVEFEYFHGQYRVAEHVFVPPSENETFEVDLKSQPGTIDFAGAGGEHPLYVPASVDMVEVDGEVIYEESTDGGGGFGGDKQVPLGTIILALVVGGGVLVVVRG